MTLPTTGKLVWQCGVESTLRSRNWPLEAESVSPKSAIFGGSWKSHPEKPPKKKSGLGIIDMYGLVAHRKHDVQQRPESVLLRATL